MLLALISALPAALNQLLGHPQTQVHEAHRKPLLYLFLDFDGVLHAVDGPWIGRLPLLEAWLRRTAGQRSSSRPAIRFFTGLAARPGLKKDLGQL